MRKVVAFLFACWMLGGSLLPGFGIDQSAHWGDLMLHFQQHRQTSPDLGFADFLRMHYGANSEHHKHPNHSHQNLPSIGHSAPINMPAVVGLGLVSLAYPLLIAKATFFRKADLYAFLTVFALINPPPSVVRNRPLGEARPHNSYKSMLTCATPAQETAVCADKLNTCFALRTLPVGLFDRARRP